MSRENDEDPEVELKEAKEYQSFLAKYGIDDVAPLPKSMQKCFKDTETTESSQMPSSTWQMLLSYVSDQNFSRNLLPASDLLDENTTFMFEAATYMVLRLEEAIQAIFRTHPLRVRGQMYVASLAWYLARSIEGLLPPDDNTDGDEKLDRNSQKKTMKRKTAPVNSNGSSILHHLSFTFRLKRDSQAKPGERRLAISKDLCICKERNAKLAFRKQMTVRLLPKSRKGTMSTPRIDDDESLAAASMSSIHSLFGVFSASVNEGALSSFESESAARKSSADEFCAGEFPPIMHGVLENRKYKNSGDSLVDLRHLSRILADVSDSGAAFVNRAWGSNIFKPETDDAGFSHDVSNELSVKLVQCCLAVLHRVNRDICGSRKNQFEHVRLVKELTMIKRHTEVTHVMFFEWRNSLKAFDNQMPVAYNPVNLLEKHLVKNVTSFGYETKECSHISNYHNCWVRRYKDERRDLARNVLLFRKP